MKWWASEQEPKSLEKRLYDGDQAKLVLENEAFGTAFDDIEKDLIESWRNLPAKVDKESVNTRERLHLAVQMLGKVKSTLVTAMETGKLAKLDLEYERSLSQKVRDLVSPR